MPRTTYTTQHPTIQNHQLPSRMGNHHLPAPYRASIPNKGYTHHTHQHYPPICHRQTNNTGRTRPPMLPMPPRGGGLQRPQSSTMRTMPPMDPRPLPTPTHTNKPTHPNRRMDMPRMRPTHKYKPMPPPNMHDTVYTNPTHQICYPKMPRGQTGTIQIPN